MKDGINKNFEPIVVLNNIRSVFNTASIFRIADCVGVKRIILCGVTPEPIDRFGRVRKDFAKVSLGAEKTVPYEYFKKFVDAVENLKKQNIKIVALEQDKRSKNFKDFTPTSNMAVVVGREREGFSKEDLDMCDEIVEIPMRGQKESLNVNVALAVFLFSKF
jgi:tRNA G18 (ribose-2'-O)-methylase SpoU